VRKPKTQKEDMSWHLKERKPAVGEARSFPVEEEEWAEAAVSGPEESAFAPIVAKRSRMSAGRHALK